MKQARPTKRDHHLRRSIFTEATFHHKATANLYWLAWLIDQYMPAEEILLDPMGGAGSILIAALKQRPVITGDIEPHWAQLQAKNAARIRATQLFAAPMLAGQWDATQLPIPSNSIPAIVTSPPYFDLFSNWSRKHGTGFDGPVGETGLCYGFHAEQIGNIHIYEEYLRAMRQVYAECWRILRPGGILVLILGDKVRKGQVVPVTENTEMLCRANGFRLVDTHRREVIPSYFRRIHAQRNGANYPLIEHETAHVFKKENHLPAYAFAIIEAPSPNSSPGTQLFNKQLTHASTNTGLVLTLTKQGFYVGQEPKAVWSGDHPRKAKARREWAYNIVRTLVHYYGLGAGDEVELHVTDRYARYLQQRLNTIGARATIPTAHLNFGQKLRWYTQASLQQDQTQFHPSKDKTAFQPVTRKEPAK